MPDRNSYCNYLLHQLQPDPIGDWNVTVNNNDTNIDWCTLRPAFRQILDEIADSAYICHESYTIQGLAKLIAEEVAEWLDAIRTYIEKHNPYRMERKFLECCVKFDNKTFAKYWPLLYPWLGARYSENELDLPFYVEEFGNNVHMGNEVIRCEFLADWEQALLRKETRYELETLAIARQQFEYLLERCTKSSHERDLATANFNLCLGLEPGLWKTQTFNLLKMVVAICKENTSIIHLLNELGRKSCERHDVKTKSDERHMYINQFRHAVHSDIDGICESNRLDALLPIEIALLGEPRLEREFYRKFVEQRLQTFDYWSHKPTHDRQGSFNQIIETAGPYIVCIDTSGSMCGKPEEVAKAICFCLLLRAREERRTCYLISYSQHIEVLDLSDWRQNRSQIIDFLSHSFCGGTDLEPAITESLRILRTCNWALADVLVISDFILGDISSESAEAMQTAQTRNTRFHALEIGSQGNVTILHRFDSLWTYNPQNRQITKTLPK